MSYHLFIILVLACAVFVIARSAPDWGPLPYEYFHEFYDHYGEDLRNNIDHMQHVHEAHHENQHRMHEDYQENFNDVTEQQQEGAESQHEAFERSQEDQRSEGGKKKSVLPNKVNPQISDKEAKSFLRKITILR
ncbi:uncharacterized protein LOC144660389 [Oculina patagonica]